MEGADTARLDCKSRIIAVIATGSPRTPEPMIKGTMKRAPQMRGRIRCLV
ncbi:hypothetical protein ASZ90_013198 [hydrocarbon metagenome]|uniref:Uncharacterized protein n=1 Tax=hydrocarbon metagenome TaxID=938273 RepID=A0A0W8F8D9_9ZZZZ